VGGGRETSSLISPKRRKNSGRGECRLVRKETTAAESSSKTSQYESAWTGERNEEKRGGTGRRLVANGSTKEGLEVVPKKEGGWLNAGTAWCRGKAVLYGKERQGMKWGAGEVASLGKQRKEK